jgi:hypothetical protein
LLVFAALIRKGPAEALTTGLEAIEKTLTDLMSRWEGGPSISCGLPGRLPKIARKNEKMINAS